MRKNNVPERSVRRTRRGFSLIEVMVAAVVLGFTVAVVGALYPTGARLREKSGNVSRAAALLARKMEQIRQYKYDQLNYATLFNARVIDEDPDGNTSNCHFTQADNLAAQLPEPHGELDISHLEPDLARIDIRITWGGWVTIGNQVSATTYIADKDVKVVP
ncbi:MAG: prepilin-type N-terminal cleavage/methylation domain-containing protein [Armatimonadetes bacterium]|nr:prepilin-type N-terminal cleavage/methylation domain-containing protein [Armatimonadota bacterium]